MATDYEELWAPLLRPYGLMLIDRVPLEGARRVLDLGCGLGGLLPELERRTRGGVVVGADLTEGMLRRAPARFARVAMDCTQPALAAGSFDAIVSAFMLFHVPDPPVAFHAIRELLAPGGGFAAAVWGTGEVFPAADAWDAELDRLDVPPDPTPARADGRERMDAPNKLSELMEGAGLADIRAESVAWSRRWDLDHFVEWRRRMGPSGRRMALLDPGERDRVAELARARVVELGQEALEHRDEVVLGSARAA